MINKNKNTKISSKSRTVSTKSKIKPVSRTKVATKTIKTTRPLKSAKPKVSLKSLKSTKKSSIKATTKSKPKRSIIHKILRRKTKPDKGYGWGKLNIKSMLVFASLVALVGGGYLAYRSLAGTLPVLAGNNGFYTAIKPTRLFDTRDGSGINRNTALSPGETITIDLINKAGLPTTPVSAVTINMIATSPTTVGYATIWPTGVARPNISNINFVPGQTIANQITTKVGSDGKIQLFNSNGLTHYVFDIVGYYSSNVTYGESRFVAVAPQRLADTRNGSIGRTTPLKDGKTLKLKVVGALGIPESNVSSVIVNLTAVPNGTNGYATVWPSGQDKPLASSINYSGANIANQVTAKIGGDGYLMLQNVGGNAHFVVDITGYYTTEDIQAQKIQSGRFVSINPGRILDTRLNNGLPLKDGQSQLIKFANWGELPTNNMSAVVANITAVNMTTNGYGTVYPAGFTKPLTSNINFVGGQTIANQATISVNDFMEATIANTGGDTHYIVDVVGYFIDKELSSAGMYGSVYDHNILTKDSVEYDIEILNKGKLDGYLSMLNEPNLTTNLNGNFVQFNCYTYIAVKCSSGVSGTTTTNSPNLVTLKIPYVFVANNKYTVKHNISRTATTSTKTISIISGGVTSELVRQEYSSTTGANIPYIVSFGTFLNSYSCNITSPLLKLKIGNIKVNGQVYTVKPDSYGYQIDKTNCAGFYNIVNGDKTKNEFATFTVGVPSGTRETQAPNIIAVTYEQGCVWMAASDNNGLTSILYKIKPYDRQGDVIFEPGSTSVKSRLTCPFYVADGNYDVEVILRDLSGNETSRSFTFTKSANDITDKTPPVVNYSIDANGCVNLVATDNSGLEMYSIGFIGKGGSNILYGVTSYSAKIYCPQLSNGTTTTIYIELIDIYGNSTKLAPITVSV